MAMLLCIKPNVAEAQTNATTVNRWRIHGWLDGNDLEVQCEFAQRGAVLKGQCTTEQGTAEITGQSNGSSISWSYDGDIGGTPTTFRYQGNLSGRRMVGKISITDTPNAGAFKAEMIQ